jgi:ParB family transcriptional regulator, chromosome partitioning protein
MNATRRGLGRGLGSLIPTAAQREQAGAPLPAGAYFADVAVSDVAPNPRQPRQVFDEESLEELISSIREVGVLQPIVVRPMDGHRFELIMGERRLRASRSAGRDTIPAIVRETPDDEMLRDALMENLHRAQLNPLEEAAAYQQMIDDFGLTHDDLANRLGRSRPHISNTLRLLRLTPPVQRRVAAGVLSAGHARALVAIDDPDRQTRLADRVVAEGLSVRGLEEIAATNDDIDNEPGSDSARRSPSRPHAPGLAEIEERLVERFETRCRVQLGRRKGKISIEFASLEDLRRILAIMEGTSESSTVE